MFCNQSSTNKYTNNTPNNTTNSMTNNSSYQIVVSNNKIIYSFNKQSFPINAIFTKNYRAFCEIIIEHLADIKMQLKTLICKYELETAILKTNAELNDWNKMVTQNYIVKLRYDIEHLIHLRDDLQKLKDNEQLMKKVFRKIHGIVKT